MAIKAILCDLDGTLADSRRDITAAFEEAWQVALGGIVPSATAIAQHIGKPLATMLADLGKVVSPSACNTFLSIYRESYRRRDGRMTVLYPGVIPTLQALSTLALGVVTTKEPEQAEIVLRRLDLSGFFKHIQGLTDDLRAKPAPDTVLAALTVLRVTPSEALMVGDTPSDILAGQVAGVRTCAVTYGFGVRETMLECRPDSIIDSFGELLKVVRELEA
jgi:HAD superfamily hydrolase (TIGR01509 family)